MLTSIMLLVIFFSIGMSVHRHNCPEIIRALKRCLSMESVLEVSAALDAAEMSDHFVSVLDASDLQRCGIPLAIALLLKNVINSNLAETTSTSSQHLPSTPNLTSTSSHHLQSTSKITTAQQSPSNLEETTSTSSQHLQSTPKIQSACNDQAFPPIELTPTMHGSSGSVSPIVHSSDSPFDNSSASDSTVTTMSVSAFFLKYTTLLEY